MKFIVTAILALMLSTGVGFANHEHQMGVQKPDQIPQGKVLHKNATIKCFNPTDFRKIFFDRLRMRVILATKNDDDLHILLVNDHGSAIMAILSSGAGCVYAGVINGTLAKTGLTLKNLGPILPPRPDLEA